MSSNNKRSIPHESDDGNNNKRPSRANSSHKNQDEDVEEPSCNHPNCLDPNPGTKEVGRPCQCPKKGCKGMVKKYCHSMGHYSFGHTDEMMEEDDIVTETSTRTTTDGAAASSSAGERADPVAQAVSSIDGAPASFKSLLYKVFAGPCNDPTCTEWKAEDDGRNAVFCQCETPSCKKGIHKNCCVKGHFASGCTFFQRSRYV